MYFCSRRISGIRPSAFHLGLYNSTRGNTVWNYHNRGRRSDFESVYIKRDRLGIPAFEQLY